MPQTQGGERHHEPPSHGCGPVPQNFIPCDIMHSADFAVAKCPSVCLSCSCIVSRWLKISSNVFLDPVAHHFHFFTPNADAQFQEEPLQQGCKIHEGGENVAIYD